MLFDDDYLWELASQQVNIQKNLQLIDKLVAKKEKELLQNLTSPGDVQGDVQGDVYTSDDDLMEILFDEDDEDDEDPTKGMSESEKVEYTRIRKDIEKQEKEYLQQNLTPQEQIKIKLLSYRNDLIEMAKKT